MKIKKIKSLCESTNIMQLYTELDSEGEYIGQWIGNGKCRYAVEGLPPVEAEHICSMFDWGEKRIDKMVIEESRLPVECDMKYSVTDIPLQNMGINLVVNGKEYTVFEEETRVCFVESNLLAPVYDEIDKIQIVKRSESVLLVRRGMITIGMLMPTRLFHKDKVKKILNEMLRFDRV